MASFDSPAAAADRVDLYRNLISGPRVPVDSLRSADRARVRVVVGQQPTAAQVLALKGQLPGIPPDAWVLRIRDR